jgi:hypothetical protein
MSKGWEREVLAIVHETLERRRMRANPPPSSREMGVAAANSDSHRVRVRGVMLALPAGTIATGVTGLQMHGITSARCSQ